MSKVIRVRYGITRQGSEPYSSDRVDVELEAEEGEDFQTVLGKCKRLCAIGIGKVTQKDIDEAKALLDTYGSIDL